MTDLTALEGELAALRSFLAALLSVLPVSLQLRAIPAFEHNLELLQDRLCPSAQAASARAAASLVARQRQVKAADKGQGEYPPRSGRRSMRAQAS